MVGFASVQRTSETQAAAVLTIKALCDPGTIGRVTNVFMLRGVIPAFLSMHRADPYLLINVQLNPEDGFDEQLLERLRALVCVDRANWVGTAR